MAVGAAQLYNNALNYLMDGTAPWESSALRAALVTSSYTPADTHDAWSSVSGNEVSAGGGYSTHGEAIASAAVSVDGSFNTVVDSAIVTWGSSTTITAKYFVVVEDADANAALASTDKLIFYVDLSTGGGSVSSSSGTFSLDAHSTLGWFYIPVQA